VRALDCRASPAPLGGLVEIYAPALGSSVYEMHRKRIACSRLFRLAPIESLPRSAGAWVKINGL